MPEKLNILIWFEVPHHWVGMLSAGTTVSNMGPWSVGAEQAQGTAGVGLVSVLVVAGPVLGLVRSLGSQEPPGNDVGPVSESVRILSAPLTLFLPWRWCLSMCCWS